MALLRVLLTGFGPFPGAPDNPSAWLAETLGGFASVAYGAKLHTQVLPTEWERVARLAPALYATLQPDVLIHFGLSRRAAGFRLERSAHNRTARRTDAAGALPASEIVEAEGADRLDSPFPASSLALALRALGLASQCSSCGGLYLCNYLYYLSLAWAARQSLPCYSLFIHIPPREAEGGPFSDQALVQGASVALRHLLAFAAERRNAPAPMPGIPTLAAPADAATSKGPS